MRTYLRRTLVLAAVVLVVGCGDAHPPSAPRPGSGTSVAAISEAEVQAYVRYALGFYSWAGGNRPSPVVVSSCAYSGPASECTILRKQVISRLLEEHIVAQYAERHGISLSKADLKRVAKEFNSVMSASSNGRKLTTAANATSAFMHQLLRNQVLVTRVESAVVPRALLAGPSFKLRKFVFDGNGAGRKRALDLATSGQAETHSPASPVHWVASQRLDIQVRRAAALASVGEFVGPFSLAGKNVVYEVLAHGRHTYGKPAREQIRANYFRQWMTKKVLKAESKCGKQRQAELACSLVHH